MNNYKFYIRLVFSFAALFADFGAVQAQQAGQVRQAQQVAQVQEVRQIQQTSPSSIGITPVMIDAKVKRGASYTQSYVITNSTGARLRFRVSAEDIWYDEQNKRQTGRAGTLPRSATLWTQFSPSEVVVEPNASATVKSIVTVPQGATGSFYTVPVFEGLPADQSFAAQISTATIGVRFRGLMMLTTSEGSEYNVEIMNGKITPPTASSELGLTLDLRNRGTAHAKVRAAFAVLSADGKLAGRGKLDEKTYLPTQRKNLDGKWSGELAPGNYTCVVTLSYNRVGMEPTSLAYEIPFTVK